MKFSVSRETLLQPLTLVAGAVERRQTMPVLANILCKVQGNKLQITGTDLEVELSATIEVSSGSDGATTLPARKLVDICKSLPEGSDIRCSLSAGKATLQAGKSRFSLATLAAEDFPAVQRDESSLQVELLQKDIVTLIQRTSFSMAQQDVRYYLNGMLWEIDDQVLRTVATDGHRLAVTESNIKSGGGSKRQLILPRKGVLELARLLSGGSETETITIEFGGNHVRVATGDMVFISKLVDGKFPDYQRVLPKGGDKLVRADRLALKSALQRAAILSNEKYRGVRFLLSPDTVSIQANNPEQEEANEEVVVDYQGAELEMGFNVNYLIDVLGVLETEEACITLSDTGSSALIQNGDLSGDALYVVMPMRL